MAIRAEPIGLHEAKQLRRWAVQCLLGDVGTPGSKPTNERPEVDFAEEFRQLVADVTGVKQKSAGLAFASVRSAFPHDVAQDIHKAIRKRNAVSHPIPLGGADKMLSQAALALSQPRSKDQSPGGLRQEHCDTTTANINQDKKQQLDENKGNSTSAAGPSPDPAVLPNHQGHDDPAKNQKGMHANSCAGHATKKHEVNGARKEIDDLLEQIQRRLEEAKDEDAVINLTAQRDGAVKFQNELDLIQDEGKRKTLSVLARDSLRAVCKTLDDYLKNDREKAAKDDVISGHSGGGRRRGGHW